MSSFQTFHYIGDSKIVHKYEAEKMLCESMIRWGLQSKASFVVRLEKLHVTASPVQSITEHPQMPYAHASAGQSNFCRQPAISALWNVMNK